MTENKKSFFRLLDEKFPNQDPDIQSMDGFNLDIIWGDSFFVTINETDHYAITYHGTFHYFTESSSLLTYMGSILL